ncbi:conserved hypothetical protein [Burkholderia mallei PRL-20]|uniref:Uncharacterized protein n=1 Tax=Burkholderia pseudomallei 1710a TaxID=320371 RepID=A0A0E1W4M3_BURPE|nr:hypothetical protein BMASAVP1_A0225 [Burkholderia mallei SAVP1]ABO04559.1 hypothetical protein BMA10247_3194 [Burkholderia mallei NCTC 10247]EES43406.1 conserved hypothetical protein [Burkholderia mallei PRL-20]EET07329.1 hypothetical protein BURPS1710A_0722 [Burkholderia pseudomallei 1710a]
MALTRAAGASPMAPDAREGGGEGGGSGKREAGSGDRGAASPFVAARDS